jgi:hypothetical protein
MIEAAPVEGFREKTLLDLSLWTDLLCSGLSLGPRKRQVTRNGASFQQSSVRFTTAHHT